MENEETDVPQLGPVEVGLREPTAHEHVLLNSALRVTLRLTIQLNDLSPRIRDSPGAVYTVFWDTTNRKARGGARGSQEGPLPVPAIQT